MLTFTPERFFRLWRRGVRWAWEALTLADEREGVRQDAERSWTPLDLDVLAPARTLVSPVLLVVGGVVGPRAAAGSTLGAACACSGAL